MLRLTKNNQNVLLNRYYLSRIIQYLYLSETYNERYVKHNETRIDFQDYWCVMNIINYYKIRSTFFYRIVLLTINIKRWNREIVKRRTGYFELYSKNLNLQAVIVQLGSYKYTCMYSMTIHLMNA